MKKFKKIIAMCCAAVMAVSAMSMSAFASNKLYESGFEIPTISEVDTSKATVENPVTYIDEKTGTIVTIYDPAITVEFPEIMPTTLSSVVVDGRIYVKKVSEDGVGSATDSFTSTKTGTVYFTLSDFNFSEYNVSLNKTGTTDSPLVVLENKLVDVPVAFKGVENGVSYQIHVNSWLGAGNATYEVNVFACDNDFSDIDGHWAEETIVKFKDKNIISGYPDGTFKPDNSVTRAEFAKIVTEAFDLQMKSELNYDDVEGEEWYYPYLECSAKYIPVYALPVSYETNIPYQEVYEKGSNDFLPETAAIRMHIAETLVKVKKDKENIDLELPIIQEIQKEIQSVFKDDDYENLYVMHGKVPENVQRMFEYTWLANELGIMQGNTDGYFMPYAKITRAELITAIDRLLKY